MKRRELLKSASILAATPLLNPFSEFATSHQNNPQNAIGRIKRFGDGRDWFFEKRYGMFVHWGLYSIPGWHEQHQWRGRVERKEYVKLAQQWNPVKFNPEQWLDLMEEAGMQYMTVTTKHHDGFCLWDTKQTAFNTINTPYKKDVIGMLADACQKRKIPLCLYYSIADWNHPNYPNEGRHHELSPQPGDSPDWNQYMDFLKNQVTELCSNYGEIHGFWWDMNVPQYKDSSVNEMIRKLQPKAVINNRGFDEGDFGTPERDYDAAASAAKAFEKPTEACQSVGMESWGYKKDEDYYSDRHLEASIDKYLARDANYLLNVGPTDEGVIPPESAAILKRIGTWKQSVNESFSETEPGDDIIQATGILATTRKQTVYIHLNLLPAGNGVKLNPITVKPQKAVLLNNEKAVDFEVSLCPSDHITQQPYLRIRNLPVDEFANSVMVVRLDFDQPLSEIKTPAKNTDIELTK